MEVLLCTQPFLFSWSCLSSFIKEQVHMYNIYHKGTGSLVIHLSPLSLISYIWPITDSCCLNSSLLALCLLLHIYYQCSSSGPPIPLSWTGSLKSIWAHSYLFTNSSLTSLKLQLNHIAPLLISHSMAPHKLKLMPSVHYREYGVLDGQAPRSMFSV